ncbi:hypothetical protein FGIG_06650 [Fasciola gigantica]|uniref:Uncharacterized protein n=1 Tax=Fasciola gigantica TaxID=46835 RepID=A0A504YRW2_FASGI|nr:hypothetical protein FGIG_06650 [Fasciola gigantica]
MEGASWWNERLWNSQPRDDSRNLVQKINTQNSPNIVDRIIPSETNASVPSEIGKNWNRPNTSSIKRTTNPIAFSNSLLQSTLQRPVISSLRPGTAGRSRPLGTLRIFYLSKPLSVKDSQNVHQRSAEERQWVVDPIEPCQVDIPPVVDVSPSNQTTPRKKLNKAATSQNNSDDEESTIFEDLSLINPHQRKNTVNHHVYQDNHGRHVKGLPPSSKRRISSATVGKKTDPCILRKALCPQVHRSSPWTQFRMHTEGEEARDGASCTMSNVNSACSSASQLLQTLRQASNGYTTSLSSRAKSLFNLSSATVPCLSVSPITFQSAKTPRTLASKRTHKSATTENQGFQKPEPIQKGYSLHIDDRIHVSDKASRPKTASVYLKCLNNSADTNESWTKSHQFRMINGRSSDSQMTKEPMLEGLQRAQTDCCADFWDSKVSEDIDDKSHSKFNKEPEPRASLVDLKSADPFVIPYSNKSALKDDGVVLVAFPSKSLVTNSSGKDRPEVQVSNESVLSSHDSTFTPVMVTQESTANYEHSEVDSPLIAVTEFESATPVSIRNVEQSRPELNSKDDEQNSGGIPGGSILSQNWIYGGTDHESEKCETDSQATVREGNKHIQLHDLPFPNTTKPFSMDSGIITQKMSELNVKLTLLNKKASTMEQQLIQSRMEKSSKQGQCVQSAHERSSNLTTAANEISSSLPLTIDVHLQHASFSSEKPDSSSEEYVYELVEPKSERVKIEEDTSTVFEPEKNEESFHSDKGSEPVVEMPISKEYVVSESNPENTVTDPSSARSDQIHIAKVVELISGPSTSHSITHSDTSKLISLIESKESVKPGEQAELDLDPVIDDDLQEEALPPLKSILKRSCQSGRSSVDDSNPSSEVAPSLCRSNFSRWAIYAGQQSSSVVRSTSLRRPFSAQVGHRTSSVCDAGCRHLSCSKSPRIVGSTRRSSVRFDMKNNSIYEFHPLDIIQTPSTQTK